MRREKKYPAEHLGGKKNILPTRLLGKKKLADQKSPNIGPISKVILLKLFLDIVLSSSADITRALRECFRGEFISFRFVSF